MLGRFSSLVPAEDTHIEVVTWARSREVVMGRGTGAGEGESGGAAPGDDRAMTLRLGVVSFLVKRIDCGNDGCHL